MISFYFFCEVRKLAADGKLLFETGIDNNGFTVDLGKITTMANSCCRGGNGGVHRGIGGGYRHRNELRKLHVAGGGYYGDNLRGG